jgi:penicillin G amidase
MPGDGAYEWQGFEQFADMPHALNPQQGYLVNWNNKPAKGWWSKQLDPTSSSFWGDEDQVVSLDHTLAANPGQSFERFGQFPRDVAYLDNRARVLMPDVLSALQSSGDAEVQAMLPYLRSWDMQRSDLDNNGNYSTPAVVFFDRVVEHFLRDVAEPTLGATDTQRISGMADCGSPPCPLVSVDNLAAPTYKFEFATEELALAALRGETAYDWLAGGAGAVIRSAASQAAADLAKSSGTTDVSKWNEPAEQGVFSPQGAGSVPNVVPLPNRGSYGQVVEPLVSASGTTAAGAVQGASTGGAQAVGLVNTSTDPPSGLPSPLVILVVAGGLSLRRSRRRGR